MASSGYADETKFESIWDTSWDSTRFNNINARIGSILNFLIQQNDTDITDANVTPILAQITEEIILDLAARAKVEKVVDPWSFIAANISKIDWRYYDTYLLDKVRQYLGQDKLELVKRDLPSSTSSW